MDDRRKKSALYIALFVLIAVIAAGLMYIWFLKYNLEQEAQFRAETEAAKLQKEQLEQIRSETDGWLAYRSKYIEFKYPPDWKIYNENATKTFVSITALQEIPPATEVPQIYFSFQNHGGKTFEETFTYIDYEKECRPIVIGGKTGGKCTPAMSAVGETIYFINDILGFDTFESTNDYTGTPESEKMIKTIRFLTSSN